MESSHVPHNALSLDAAALASRESRFSHETMIVGEHSVYLRRFAALPSGIRSEITEALSALGVTPEVLAAPDGATLILPRYTPFQDTTHNVAQIVGRILHYTNPHQATIERQSLAVARRRSYPVSLDARGILERACRFAAFIEARRADVESILLRYETFEVGSDELSRTLDLLVNLAENAEYFDRQVGRVASFLPRNQPLYALSCFGIVPSLMAQQVHVHVPTAMRHFFYDLDDALALHEHFPNLYLSRCSREEFVQRCTGLVQNGSDGAALPVTDAVIFTGTGRNADRLRKLFHPATLFIANGAGHNPLIVTDTARLDEALASTLRVQLYNQGQDCAAPNAILVHAAVQDAFLDALRRAARHVPVGPYHDRANRVGPISDRQTLDQVRHAFLAHAKYLDPTTRGTIHYRESIVEPTIIVKPLDHGGNFREHFAPIFMIQPYVSDAHLAHYFDSPDYSNNAMYVTVFGRSDYVDNLGRRTFSCGRPLHDAATIIRDTDLHAPGIERGTQPYGGYGRWASSVSMHGKILPMPTCPQRDIFLHLVRAWLKIEAGDDGRSNEVLNQPGHHRRQRSTSRRQVRSSSPKSSASMPILRTDADGDYLKQLHKQALDDVRSLACNLQAIPWNESALTDLLYEIPKRRDCSEGENRRNQQRFFTDLYRLLLGSDTGPRLPRFLGGCDRSIVRRLLTLNTGVSPTAPTQ